MQAMISNGDEVIIPTPCWTSYPGMVTLCNATSTFVARPEDKGFKLQPRDLEAAITGNTRLILINSPCNPTGAAYSSAEMKAITDVLLRYPDIWILADDIYEHITYDGFRFCTPAQVEPLLHDRTLTLNGVSKAYSMTGWRIGYPSMLRDGVGWGSPAGVSAAYMAQMGFTGAPTITVEGDDEITRRFWDDLGQRWEITNTHYKQYPVCRWAHPAIDAADKLMLLHDLTSSDIKRARIRTFHYASRLAGHEPQTLDELTYALAFPMAIMIVKRQIGAEQLVEEILQDPEILRISRATEIVDSDHYTRISTRQRWADVTLYLKDGREIQSEPNTPRGDPEDPLSDLEISAKFHLLANPVIGVKRAAAIEGRICHMDDSDFELENLTGLVLAPVE